MITFLAFLLLLPAAWCLFLAVMHLDTARRRGGLTPAAKCIGYPILFAGYAADVAFNLTWGSILFVEVPRELLFSSRVSRHNDNAGWRGGLATWICGELLDPFDPRGQHCR